MNTAKLANSYKVCFIKKESHMYMKEGPTSFVPCVVF